MVINRLEESVEPPTGKINDFQWVGKMKKGNHKIFSTDCTKNQSRVYAVDYQFSRIR